MKKLLIILCGLVIIGACSKDEEFISVQDQLVIDIVKIDQYLLENKITALPIVTKSSNSLDVDTGIRYVVDSVGTGATPTETSTIRAKYEGRLMSNGEVFDSGNDFKFSLGGVIPGWKLGIPFFKEGGSGTLYIPSGWAYGRRGQGSIPGNAILIFDIELLEVK